jgi:D-alanyl-D-alanine carboxypeptidase
MRFLSSSRLRIMSFILIIAIIAVAFGIAERTTFAHASLSSSRNISYPQLASSYTGTAHNETYNITSNFALVSIKEDQQGNISGNTQVSPPLYGSGPFTGKVSSNNTITFTSTPTDGSGHTITFTGTVTPQHSLSGKYTANSKIGVQTGTWQVSATSGTGMADSTSVQCAAGTRDVGIQDAYNKGTPERIRLCAISNLSSTGEESTPGSPYYISGANGKGLVNSQDSKNVFEMVEAAKNAHISLRATSTFRTMAHQQALCNANAACKRGNYREVAKPGYSPHQIGSAIDFAGTHVKGGPTCSARATDRNSPVWNWLYSNASRFGYKQYSVESWHWDTLKDPNRC